MTSVVEMEDLTRQKPESRSQLPELRRLDRALGMERNRKNENDLMEDWG